MSNSQSRSHTINNKENCFMSLDKIRTPTKQISQQYNEIQYTPWNIPSFMHTKTSFNRSHNRFVMAEVLFPKNQTITKRKRANKSSQLQIKTIASDLKRQAEYLDSDIQDYTDHFFRFPTQANLKIRKSKHPKSVKSNNFFFNIIQQKKTVPRIKISNKYIRLHSQSLQTHQFENTSSKQTIIFNKITKKTNQQTNINQRRFRQPNKFGSTQEVYLHKEDTSSNNNQGMLNNLSKLVRGRRLKMFKTRISDFM